MSDLYIPTNHINLKEVKLAQIRLGLQSDPGTGKTLSAMTFPNVIVADFDQGLNRFVGQDIVVVPFYDEDFVRDILKFPKTKDFMYATKNAAFANRRDAFRRWLQDEGLKLRAHQTLLVDSWTALQNAFDLQQDTDNPKLTKDGEVNDFDFWAKKISYSEAITTLFKACKCHIVVTFHEDKMRDPKTGLLLDKIGPLMQGGFTKQLKSHFTDFFRCVKDEKKDKDGKVVSEEFYWQVRSDNRFEAKTKLYIPNGIILVEPNFSIFEKYSKPISSGN